MQSSLDLRPLAPGLAVAPQIGPADIVALHQAGYRAIVCNRPDGEAADQPLFAEIAKLARELGLQAHYLPAESGKVSDAQADAFGALFDSLPKPVLAYCRSGMRSTTMWALSQAHRLSLPDIVTAAGQAGYDMKGVVRRIVNQGRTPLEVAEAEHCVVIVGAGAAGVATAASLLARYPELDVALIDPAEVHYYQPGWTLVGAGVCAPASTARTMAATIPRGAHWIKAAVAAFEPERNAVILDGCRVVRYQQLVVCPGIKLDWQAVPGLAESLGRHGVTSNYLYHLAPYTWQLVRKLRAGRAVFSQPPMPIKCAGAPQKAMYLSADHWRRAGLLEQIRVDFYSAAPVLFGVPDYVPALMEYVAAYDIDLHFGHTLCAVDGPRKRASFSRVLPDGGKEIVERDYDLLHVVPPQTAPDFIRVSPLADAAGWVDIDPASLRHRRHANIHGLGDAGSSANAKTAAAARKQAPVVAHNVLAALGLLNGAAQYDGYGSCPLTVERGKIVLAEFGYGGKLAPSLPTWLVDGTRPSRLAWLLKARMLPPLYWRGMLKGREWLAKPELSDR